MDNLAVPVLIVLQSLTPWRGDRGVHSNERDAGLREQAEAFTTVTDRVDELAILTAYGWHETKYATQIMLGHCDRMPAGERCDKLRARGVLSIHPWCQKAWALPDGSLESKIEEARCALRIIRYGKQHCRNSALSPVHGAFAALAGRPCNWVGREDRVKTYRTVLERLRRAK
jgi:hypothetical protein